MVNTKLMNGHGGLNSMVSFGHHVFIGRWFMVFTNLLIMSMAGETYMFGLYSDEIKSSLGLGWKCMDNFGFNQRGSAIVVLILLFAPLIIVFQEDLKIWYVKQQDLDDPHLKVVSENPPSVELTQPHKLTLIQIPAPMMLTLVLLLSSSGHLLIAFGVPNSLYIASILMMFCFRAQWPLIFAIISELFGLKYYSTLYNFGGGASPVGAYLLNVRVTGHLYDKVATKQMLAKGLKRKIGQDLTCIGVESYKLAILIITGATLLSCAISLILVIRTRKFHKGDIYKKFREQAKNLTCSSKQQVNMPACCLRVFL
ncbi:hypothetical protein H5410_060067 [Solanum commersonii]|uniref:Nodulin-like domain-containing protein n=1 Tax=Solanum commersonii TaxID=4109 RepID=A0A9J5W438_SOLCO|nr:hypothetical protein H5410_060067 [Solanum commersonii]